MVKSYTFFLILCLILTGCKSDNQEKTDSEESIPQTEKVDDNTKLLRNIKSAHNAQKFNSEAQVKFHIKFSLKDSVFFYGFVTLKTDGSKARFMDSKIDRVVEVDKLQTELDKKLFMIAEAYTMGFWFEDDDFKILSKNDSLDISTYRSPKTQSTFKIYSHPITHVIRQIDYKTNINQKPFNLGSLYYEKYITVNRVPVALHWRILDENTNETSAEISRISYPEQF